MNTKKRFIIPLILSIIINLIIIIIICLITYQIPQSSVSSLYLIKNWIKIQSIFLRIWTGLMIFQYIFLLITSNASKPIFNSLSSIFILSLLSLIKLSNYLNCSDQEGDIRLQNSSSVYYKSPPISKKGLIPFSDSYSTYTTSSASGSGTGTRSVKTGKDNSKDGSVRITIDKLVSESTYIPPPPSAYTYGGGKDRRTHTRHTSSPLSTPIYSDYPDIPLSIIAPLSQWIDYDSNDNDKIPYYDRNQIEDDRESYKSAVPSGKTLLRTKSERSKKDRGIVLDHEGWNVEVPLPIPTTFEIIEKSIDNGNL
uniref:Uncharacterized protein n=1 Tax=Kwoniella pini CBS 10737 TaxID=1296096 RepID=A0A1B9HUX7_9TREE|nr:uncharacterized protein I206_06845 [Kwoniella pini CBS 10737]OCF47071.1 hypothetical protein I206_06845 [Kwoniella pini CBS 10737]